MKCATQYNNKSSYDFISWWKEGVFLLTPKNEIVPAERVFTMNTYDKIPLQRISEDQQINLLRVEFYQSKYKK